jgi:hypothetical protein
VESILYGLFIVLFIASTFILLQKFRSTASSVNKPMLVASVTMFILATVHVGTDLKRMMDAFLNSSDIGGPVAFLSEVNTPIYALKSTAYTMQTLVGDAFIIYRLHLVWNGDKRVVVPILICFTASIGVGIGALQAFARASPDAPVFITALQRWIVSFFSLTLFTNFSSTTLIAFRIWWIHRNSKGAVGSGRSVLPAMVVIIESGSIYSACLVILLSLYLSGSFSQYIVLDAVTQVIGVVFSLVIVRVALGISSESATAPTKMATFRVREVGGRTTDVSEPDTLINMKPSRVNITKTFETDEEV